MRLANDAADLLRCACGNEWFELVSAPDGDPERELAVLAVDRSGKVIDRLGGLQCLTCGEIVDEAK